MNITCLITKEYIQDNTEFYLMPLAKSKAYSPTDVIKDRNSYSVYSYSHTSCYPTAYYDYFAPIIKVYKNDGFLFLAENNLNLNNFKHLLNLVIKKDSNSLSHIYIKGENYSYNQYNIILNKLFKESNNVLEVPTYWKDSILKFSAVSKQVISYIYKNIPAECSLMNKKLFCSIIQDKLNEIKKESNPILLFRHLNFDIEYPFVTNSSRSLMHRYPRFIYQLLTDYAEQIKVSEVNDQEFIENLHTELTPLFEHIEIDRLLDNLNIKLQPIVLFDHNSNNKYLSMVNFVKNKVNKDVKKRYNDW